MPRIGRVEANALNLLMSPRHFAPKYSFTKSGKMVFLVFESTLLSDSFTFSL